MDKEKVINSICIACRATQGGTLKFGTGGFDSLVNSFRYYNCDRQRGKRIIFFAKCDKMGKLLHT